MKKLKIGVVVNCYNRFRELDAVLVAIKGQSRKPDDIVVVDDQSEENMKNVCVKHKVRYMRQEYPQKKARPGQARNKGWNDLKTDFILFIDNDIIVDKNYIEVMEKIYNDSKDKNIVLVAGYGGDIKQENLNKVDFDKIMKASEVLDKSDTAEFVALLWRLCYRYDEKRFRKEFTTSKTNKDIASKYAKYLV